MLVNTRKTSAWSGQHTRIRSAPIARYAWRGKAQHVEMRRQKLKRKAKTQLRGCDTMTVLHPDDAPCHKGNEYTTQLSTLVATYGSLHKYTPNDTDDGKLSGNCTPLGARKSGFAGR